MFSNGPMCLEWFQNIQSWGPNGPQWSQMEPQIFKMYPHGGQMVPKCKMVPKWSQNGPPKPTLSDPRLKPHFGIDFERDLGSILDSKTGQKIIKKCVLGDTRISIDFWSVL